MCAYHGETVVGGAGECSAGIEQRRGGAYCRRAATADSLDARLPKVAEGFTLATCVGFPTLMKPDRLQRSVDR